MKTSEKIDVTKFYKKVSEGRIVHTFAGPFESVRDAWMHSYANDEVDVRKSNVDSGLLILKNGEFVSIRDGKCFLEDAISADKGYFSDNRKYKIVRPSPVAYPEFWPEVTATELHSANE